MQSQRPFSDSMVSFYDVEGRLVGPLRVTVFMQSRKEGIQQPVVMVTADGNGIDMQMAAHFVCNRLYRGAFPDPKEILWVERHTGPDNSVLHVFKNDIPCVPLNYPRVEALFGPPGREPVTEGPLMDLARQLPPLDEHGRTNGLVLGSTLSR